MLVEITKESCFMKLKLFLFVAILIAAVSCKTQDDESVFSLSAPELEISDVTDSSFKVTWKAIEGAEEYQYEFDGKTGAVAETELTFSELEAGATYTLKVKAVSAETESEWAESSVTLNPKEEVKFNLQVNIDGYDLYVQTSPTDKDFKYYMEPVPESMFLEAGSDPAVLIEKMMATYEQFYGSASAAYNNIVMSGDKNLKYDISKYLEKKYYVVIAGIDENLKLTGEAEYAEVEVEFPISDNQFEVTMIELIHNRIVFKVTPSNEDQYAIILQDTKTVEALSETQLGSFLTNLVNEKNIMSGETMMIYDKNIVPSHDFSILVFGWDKSFTTEIFRKDIRTPDPEEVDELTFELTADVKGPTTAICKIVPSNEKASYFYDVVSVKDWTEKYQSDPKVYIEKMAAQNNWAVSKYLNLFGSVGTQQYTYGKSYLSPGGDFVLFAIGFQNKDGEIKYLEPQQITFSTPAE